MIKERLKNQIVMVPLVQTGRISHIKWAQGYIMKQILMKLHIVSKRVLNKAPVNQKW